MQNKAFSEKDKIYFVVPPWEQWALGNRFEHFMWVENHLTCFLKLIL